MSCDEEKFVIITQGVTRWLLKLLAMEVLGPARDASAHITEACMNEWQSPLLWIRFGI